MADKTDAIARLSDLALPIPTSLRVTAANVRLLHSFIEQNPDTSYWYLRFDDRAAQSVPRVASRADIVFVVGEAVGHYPELAFIVQERLAARCSGVLALRPDGLFIEHVSGELRGLLREGVTPARTLLSRTGRVIGVRRGEQEFICRWEGPRFERFDEPVSHSELTPATMNQLLDAARVLQADCLLEFVETQEGKIVFLDHRWSPQNFLVGVQSLANSLSTGIFRSLPTTLFKAPVEIESSGIIVVDSPQYKYLDSALPVAEAIVAKAGGILAHLCVYAAELGIPCLVLDGASSRAAAGL